MGVDSWMVGDRRKTVVVGTLDLGSEVTYPRMVLGFWEDEIEGSCLCTARIEMQIVRQCPSSIRYGSVIEFVCHMY